jgi:hypothetical protein
MNWRALHSFLLMKTRGRRTLSSDINKTRPVILSEAKDLRSLQWFSGWRRTAEILRFAEDDTMGERGEA